jgi:hypothetical protein
MFAGEPKDRNVKKRGEMVGLLVIIQNFIDFAYTGREELFIVLQVNRGETTVSEDISDTL